MFYRIRHPQLQGMPCSCSCGWHKNCLICKYRPQSSKGLWSNSCVIINWLRYIVCIQCLLKLNIWWVNLACCLCLEVSTSIIWWAEASNIWVSVDHSSWYLKMVKTWYLDILGLYQPSRRLCHGHYCYKKLLKANHFSNWRFSAFPFPMGWWIAACYTMEWQQILAIVSEFLHSAIYVDDAPSCSFMEIWVASIWFHTNKIRKTKMSVTSATTWMWLFCSCNTRR